jgi:hypothetical protein
MSVVVLLRDLRALIFAFFAVKRFLAASAKSKPCFLMLLRFLAESNSKFTVTSYRERICPRASLVPPLK